MITVLIPDRGVTGYTLYAAGDNISKPVRFPDEGGFRIAFKGVVILLYTYCTGGRKRRHAFVVCEEGDGLTGADLECVNKPVKIIYEATGRKVDLLKRIKYWARGRSELYRLDVGFWIAVTRLIDLGFNGKESALTPGRFEKLVCDFQRSGKKSESVD